MTFLEQVAQYYVDKDRQGKIDLGQYTFVFPNKRSALFMSKALKSRLEEAHFIPRLVTITAFTREFCPRELANDTELLFLLYKSYLGVMPQGQARRFDAFMHIGQTILSDFNDIDAYLVDAKELYKNIENLKDISSSYLTDEQIEVAHNLGDKRDLSQLSEDADNFWVNAKEKESAQEFISLRRNLYKLYERFKNVLAERVLAYSGLQSRLAYEECYKLNADDFGGRRFAFIGFYVLPTARRLMLRRLRDIGIADFFWDTASPLLTKCGNTAGDLILPLAHKEFEMPQDFALEKIDELPEITVYSVASSAAQVKVAGEILKSWSQKDGNYTEGSKTNGVVIPHDGLLMPMLFSVPENYYPVCVAMKVPFGLTPMAQLMDSILRAYERGRFIRGEFTFYYADVVEILSNPYIASGYHASVLCLKEYIAKKHLYNVSSAEICSKFEPLAFIFSYNGDQNNGQQCRDFILNVVEHLRALGVEPTVADAYADAVRQIFALVGKYFPDGLDMKDHTLFSLVRKIVATTHIDLNGDTTWGLQLMNMPDARVLDFKQLIITSLNEGILPGKDSKSSLIPPLLRRDFGLSTSDQEDITIAYQFFRLISRAKRVALIFDSRSPDLSQGEKSRFISQLELMIPQQIVTRDVKLGLEPNEPRKITIPKTPEVIEELNKFKAEGHLSASAFKVFLSCRLKFYLQYVKGLRVDNPSVEYMDASSYGTVLHYVAELFYHKLQERIGDRMITRQDISDELNKPTFDDEIKELALRAMCEKYYRVDYSTKKNALPGEARVNAKIMADYIKIMLLCEAGLNNSSTASDSSKKDNNSVDFRFIAGEESIGNMKSHVWKVNDDHTINFSLSIDRIDQLAPDSIRLIDYKTGGDKTSASQFEFIFTNHDCGAIFQLLLYCIAYKELKQDAPPKIKPLIYKLQEMATKGITDIVICGEEVKNYDQEITEDHQPFRLDVRFRERFVGILNEIFGDQQPFDQTKDLDNCKYCPFTQMCGRIDPSLDPNF